jgi:hypothetical protein
MRYGGGLGRARRRFEASGGTAMSALGSKADMPPALHMSAFDPKRTLRNLTSMSDRSAQNVNRCCCENKRCHASDGDNCWHAADNFATLIKSKSEQHDTILLLHMSWRIGPIERQTGGFAETPRDTETFFSIVILKFKKPWGFCCRKLYGLIRKTFPLPLGTYARVGGRAD